jgi:hypothetical protein
MTREGGVGATVAATDRAMVHYEFRLGSHVD